MNAQAHAKDQLLERFASLSPQLQAAARFVVDHPNEVVVHSMRTIAEHAGLQPATLVRLAQALGYAGWPELKSAFAVDLGLQDAKSYAQRARQLAARGREANLAGELFAAQRHNLELTEARLGTGLRAAARLLRQARRVHVAGFRASYAIACSFAYGYRLFRHTVQLVDGQGGGLEMQQRAIERGDALVVISFAPYSREAQQVMEAALAAGAKVLALTDSEASPLALQAHVALLFAADSPSFFPSIAAAIATSDALLEALVAEAGPEVAAAVDSAEQQLFDSGAYLQPPPRRGPARGN